MSVVCPPALRAGDAVALVAPAGPLGGDEDVERALGVVRDLGFVPRLGAHAADRDGYLAGSDEARASDLNAAIADPNVRGIFAMRGGYGTMRILDAADFDGLRRDPKVVLGYSDLTALLNAIVSRSGIVAFHGPVAALSSFSDPVVEALRRAVCTSDPIGPLRVPEATVIYGGVARGHLAGGNLSLIAALEGTPYAIDSTGAILFFEEVDEAPYRVDRMLTQLRLSGALSRANGIVAGTFSNCEASQQQSEPSWTLAQTLDDRLRDLERPAIAGASIGHVEEQWTIPIGVMATLDAHSRTLTIEEPAVSR